MTKDRVKLMFSAPDSPRGGAAAQPDPARSLGGFMSATPVPAWGPSFGGCDDSRPVSHRCFFVWNDIPGKQLLDCKVRLVGDLRGLSLAADAAGPCEVGSAGAQASIIEDEAAEPVVVRVLASWPDATPCLREGFRRADVILRGSGPWIAAGAGRLDLEIGDLGPGCCRAFWVRRSAQDRPPVSGRFDIDLIAAGIRTGSPAVPPHEQAVA